MSSCTVQTTCTWWKDQRPEPLDEELWLDLPDCPGYSVSSLGRVRRFRQPTIPYILKQHASDGYPTVWLRSRGNVKVHVLVLCAFAGPRPPGACARHLDGDAKNNSTTNLAWGSARDNYLDGVRHGRIVVGVKKSVCIRGHPLEGDGADVSVSSRGDRRCRVCRRMYKREEYKRTGKVVPACKGNVRQGYHCYHVSGRRGICCWCGCTLVSAPAHGVHRPKRDGALADAHVG